LQHRHISVRQNGAGRAIILSVYINIERGIQKKRQREMDQIKERERERAEEGEK
jgi:hypothetical protein